MFVTAIIVGFDALIAVVVNEHNMSTVLTALRLDVGLAPRLGDAVTFAVKNFVVIPLYVMAMFQAAGVVPRG